MTKKMKTMKFISDADHFNEWYDSIGIRTFCDGRNSGDQHRDYMATAFLAGYHTAERNDALIIELREQNRRLKDAINCL